MSAPVFKQMQWKLSIFSSLEACWSSVSVLKTAKTGRDPLESGFVFRLQADQLFTFNAGLKRCTLSSCDSWCRFHVSPWSTVCRFLPAVSIHSIIPALMFSAELRNDVTDARSLWIFSLQIMVYLVSVHVQGVAFFPPDEWKDSSITHLLLRFGSELCPACSDWKADCGFVCKRCFPC